MARDLQRRKAREHRGLFVAEGIRTVEELLRSPLAVQAALVAPQLAGSERGQALRAALDARGAEVVEVTETEFASASGTDTPQGVLAIASVPRRPLDALALPARARLLVLDGVQDPGNVGTILRTAAALGAVATVALPGTVDLWNAKVVRSAMGALFHHPALDTTWDDLDSFRERHGIPLWGAAADGTPVDRVSPPPRLALAVGNEGAGLSPEAARRVSERVAIPIRPEIESLNVAVSTGILLHALHP